MKRLDVGVALTLLSFVLVMLLLLILAFSSNAETPVRRMPGDVIVRRVIDGDTIVVDKLYLSKDIAIVDADVRASFDCWEISRRRRSITKGVPKGGLDKFWAEEIQKGLLAKQALENLITKHKLVIRDPTPDLYGRWVGLWFYVDDGEHIPVGRYMADRGHLRGFDE